MGWFKDQTTGIEFIFKSPGRKVDDSSCPMPVWTEPRLAGSDDDEVTISLVSVISFLPWLSGVVD